MTGNNRFYAYSVNTAVSAYHIALYLIFALIQIFYCVTTYRGYAYEIRPARMRRFIYVMVPLIIAMFLETAAYTCRLLSHIDVEQLAPYVAQSMLLLIAPLFIQASIYMLFGELLKALRAQHHSIINISLFPKIFVLGNVLSFVFQISGGVISQHDAKVGNGLVITGLFIQVIFFTLFMTCVTKFLFNIHNECTMISESLKQSQSRFGNWKHYMFVLLSGSILMFIISVFRVINFFEGRDSTLQQNEAYFYVLDSMMIIITMTAFSSFNFARYLARVEFGFNRTTGNGYSEDISLYQY